MVQCFEVERTSAKGHNIFSVVCLPDAPAPATGPGPGPGPGAAAAPPSALLCWHHGIAEHVGRYTEIFARFAAAGVAVYGFDCVGHGKSEGRRAYLESWTDVVDEFEAFCRYASADVAARYPAAGPLPMFIAGPSMGGLVAALTCLRDQSRWTGLLLCSPALGVDMGPVLRVQAAVGNLLAALVPRACIVPAVNPKHMSPVGNLPARTGNEMLKALRYLQPRWPDFRLPIYAHHGNDDKITSPTATKAFMAAAASQDKTLDLVVGGYHAVLLDREQHRIVAEMVDWMLRHATPAGPVQQAAS